MLNKILPQPWSTLATRCASSFVSRMRYVKELRRDERACAAALATGRLLLFHRLDPLLRESPAGGLASPALPCADVREVLRVLDADPSLLEEALLMGCREERLADFCLDLGRLDRATVETLCRGTFADLKKSFFLLSAEEAPLVAKANALLRWHHNNKFSGASGQPTRPDRAGSRRMCDASGAVSYPEMAPAVVALVSDGRRCLLARQASFPPGMYSALAGFCDLGESVEEALRREVAEEVGLEVEDVSYSCSQHWPHPRSSLLLGCHASVSPAHSQLVVDRAELEDARWFTLEQIIVALKTEAPRANVAPWLPPSRVVARRLITEWAEGQRQWEL